MPIYLSRLVAFHCSRKNTCQTWRAGRKELKIPVIGIGAGGGVDGQVLVIHDMLGLTQEFSPRFLRRYLNLAADIKGLSKVMLRMSNRVTFQMRKSNTSKQIEIGGIN